MQLVKYIAVAQKSLLDHKLRSFLTILGIIFGVAAVIAMMSIGEGAKREALEQIQEMGINNIFVQDRPEERKNASKQGKYFSDGLSDADIRFIRTVLTPITAHTKMKKIDGYIQTEIYNNNAVIAGVDHNYRDVLSIEMKQGRFIHLKDIEEGRNVCVVMESLYGKLTRKASAEKDTKKDEYLRINNQYFRIVGVAKDKQGYMDHVYVPLSAMVLSELFTPFTAPVSEVIFRIDDVQLISRSVNVIKTILMRRHYTIEDFELIVPEMLLRQREKTKNLFNIIMLLITSISLIVGGIGIMNIMLASVLERTREIGIRRAIGATKRDIRMQFLIESILLCLAGGVIGVVTGITLTKVIELITHWTTYLPVAAIIIAFSVSAGIGVIFGYYPAKNASELNPIEALRHE
ncbi:MAG: ABC transporter permease [Spirochaetes bacterium]|nr:ABC transporter permease [Spirochaetota bacterium]